MDGIKREESEMSQALAAVAQRRVTSDVPFLHRAEYTVMPSRHVTVSTYSLVQQQRRQQQQDAFSPCRR